MVFITKNVISSWIILKYARKKNVAAGLYCTRFVRGSDPRPAAWTILKRICQGMFIRPLNTINDRSEVSRCIKTRVVSKSQDTLYTMHARLLWRAKRERECRTRAEWFREDFCASRFVFCVKKQTSDVDAKITVRFWFYDRLGRRTVIFKNYFFFYLPSNKRDNISAFTNERINKRTRTYVINTYRSRKMWSQYVKPF